MVDQNAERDALDALRDVERRIAMQGSCASPAGECYGDHSGCYVAESLRIVREALAPFEPKICPSRYLAERLADPEQDARMQCARTEGHGGRHANQARDLTWDPGAEISLGATLAAPSTPPDSPHPGGTGR